MLKEYQYERIAFKTHQQVMYKLKEDIESLIEPPKAAGARREGFIECKKDALETLATYLDPDFDPNKS